MVYLHTGEQGERDFFNLLNYVFLSLIYYYGLIKNKDRLKTSINKPKGQCTLKKNEQMPSERGR